MICVIVRMFGCNNSDRIHIIAPKFAAIVKKDARMPQPAILTTAWSGFQLGAGFGQDLRQAGFWNRWKMAVCVFEPGKPRGRRVNNPAPTCNLDHRMVRISTWGRIWTGLHRV
jgi:hypothetical protein